MGVRTGEGRFYYGGAERKIAYKGNLYNGARSGFGIRYDTNGKEIFRARWACNMIIQIELTPEQKNENINVLSHSGTAYYIGQATKGLANGKGIVVKRVNGDLLIGNFLQAK